MSSPYRTPAVFDTATVIPNTSTSERIRDWVAKHPSILVCLLIILMLSGWVFMARAASIYSEEQTMQSARRWAHAHNGRIAGCTSTTHHYFCKVITPTANWRLVYDTFGDVQPFMIVPDVP